MIRHTAACAAVLFIAVGSAESRQGPLTLQDALRMAATSAPARAVALARVEEARARLEGASVLGRENPTLEAAAGPRSTAGSDSLDVDLEVGQALEPPGRRAARIEMARAALDRETHSTQEVERRLRRDVGVSFYEALHAGRRRDLLQAAEGIAAEIEHSVRRRYETGDVAALDLNVARAALARTRSAALAARGSERAALLRLGILLGLPPDSPVEVVGELRVVQAAAVGDAQSIAAGRPEVLMLADAGREAAAELRLARRLAWPEVGFGLRYEREDGEDVLLGGLKLTLPVLRRGREVRVEATARAARITVEQEALTRAIAGELAATDALLDWRTKAAGTLESEALPLLDENESLARRSWEAGEISLGEYLVVRREILDTRMEHLDRLLDAAVASVELDAVAGVKP